MKILNSTSLTGGGSGSRSFRTILLIGLCAVFFLASSCTQTKNPAPKSQGGSETRTANPPRVEQIDDAKVKELLKPNGRPLLVNFWATWCGPCREEFPDLVRIDEDYRGKIDFITVSLDFVEVLDTGVPAFLSEMKAGMPTYLLVSADENALISSITKQWSGALPFTILYYENGEVAYLRQGKVNHETLKGEIEKTLGE